MQKTTKLWTKVILIIIWLISTQTIRRYAAAKMRTGYRVPMLLASSVNVTCWIYGAFLGIAKPLAFGAMSFKSLLVGFDIVLLLSLCVTSRLKTALSSKPLALAFNTTGQPF